MNQVPIVPMNPNVYQQQPAYIPVQQQQPKLNAVNIEINNPSVGTQGAAQPQYAPVTAPYYTYPQAPIYNYPQPQAPVYCPVPAALPAPVEAPVAVQTAPAPAPTPAPTPAPAPAPVSTPAPAPTVNAPQINNNAPAAPVAIETTQAKAPEVPAPVVTAPSAQTVEQKPEIVQPETVAPQVDINAFISKLTNPDFDVQAAGMEEIANLIKTAPEKATELLEPKVFESLANIVNFDSTGLAEATKEQLAAREKIVTGKEVTEAEKQLANTITPKEQAERNKSYALFTTAIMQKLYLDEVARLSTQPVPLTDLPGAVNVVNNLKDNPDPMIRASAIEALSFIQRPEYKKDLTTVFNVATNDSDPSVAEAAKVALDKLNQI